MISHGKEIKVFTGNSNPELAHNICAQLYQTLGSSTVSQFADGECSISVFEPVRGKDVFIVQSTCGPVNDNLMELLIMIDAMRRASAGRITAVIPYFGYARQDRKAKSRDPISAKLVANLITAAGADRVLTIGPARGSDSGLLRHSRRQPHGRAPLLQALCQDVRQGQRGFSWSSRPTSAAPPAPAPSP